MKTVENVITFNARFHLRLLFAWIATNLQFGVTRQIWVPNSQRFAAVGLQLTGKGFAMSCDGLCKVYQNQWKEELVPGYPIRPGGSPHVKPGDMGDQKFLATATDAEIWKGEKFSEYSEMVIGEIISYRNIWIDGVKRKFPANKKKNCKGKTCHCELAKKPTVLEGWSKWRRYEVFVPYVGRTRIPGENPPKILAGRVVLKGVVRHRSRVVQGVCRPKPGTPVIAPFAELDPEND